MASSDGVNLTTVGIVADPGLPAALAERLRHTLPGRLGLAATEEVRWSVETDRAPFELMYPDSSALLEKARQYVRGRPWDFVICVTDQPMYSGSDVVLARIDTTDRVALVSLPAFGGTGLRRRLTAAVVAIVSHFVAYAGGAGNDQPRPRRQLPVPGARMSSTHPDPSRLDITVSGRRATARLLAGMVRVNRPWRLLRGLSTALAGALTGIAFGVLYSSIWSLGSALGPLRLAGVTVTAVAAMAVWLIVGHRLWEPQQPATERDREVRLRNASTVATVTAGTVAFFLAMLAIALAAVTLVIPPPYLAGTLGRPVGVVDYLVIAVMSSVLGTIAGAVGSGLEDDTAVREATYAYRERERRRRLDNGDW
ncbi:hypothetical protein [Amycolatopsis suaedae]|uniref:5,10-methylene-tetrahydrofolate dehydrogenase n=1 Tax=Amycolatopsis suaedae TaxID=2510978 RepID=A0A4Q7JBU1_9PSEU|nr:hypothetical protein [Amycolatopsis suaedae]RZQ64568.1 hypothetical protein EWH70_06565 [Amycolatopsis suaedae]